MKPKKMQSVQYAMKKIRSNLPRRRRSQISPILCSSPNPHSNASSHLTREISCTSSRLSVCKPKPQAAAVAAANKRQRAFDDTNSFRRITRSYTRKRENERAKQEREEIELSETSCVESCSGFAAENEYTNDILTRTGKSPSERKLESIFSCIDKLSDKTIIGDDVTKVPNSAESKLTESRCTEQILNLNSADVNLLCAEVSTYSPEIYQESSEMEFSFDETPSSWFDSGSQFSEKSIGETTPSRTFQLFRSYSENFCESNFSEVSSGIEDESTTDGITSLRLEAEEHEQSYQRLRKRERRQVYLHDYAREYCTNTNYGQVVIQQRLLMVHWMLEQSDYMEFQRETMFLGVNLLDRFLSKGYFKSENNLQIAGIACLTLATRIEENQPFNSVRQKAFHIEGNTYSRYEVVAMEWLVQEVLNFHCFLPTIYNFLWYYLKAANADEEVEKTAKHLAELALLGHEQLCYWPSTIAAGIVILVCNAAKEGSSCHQITEIHARSKHDNLPECMKRLKWLEKYIC